ncbi:hypothetical protein [Methylobacterium sp. Leaf111]|nr:hypothetical protein [Methylobacterium sp. Leaf111]
MWKLKSVITEKAKSVRGEAIRRFDVYEELTRPAPVPVVVQRWNK